MTKEEAKQWIPLLQAYAEGNEIQILSDDRWNKVSSPHFDLPPDNYRIEPEPREFWIVVNSTTNEFIAVYKEKKAANNYSSSKVYTIIHVKEVL